VKFLEVNPNVRSFAIEPEGIQVPREADRAAKNIDATAELRNGEHEHHVLDLSATFRQENSSSVLADYPSNVGLRIFSESDLFPLGAEAMRWLKLINYCAAIRNEDHKEAAIACIATMRKLDGGTLGQVLDVLSNFDSQIVIGVFSRMVIQNDIAVDLSSASFSLASEWTWRCAT
jgi:hypothetical protein